MDNLNQWQVVVQMSSYTMELRDVLATLLVFDRVDISQMPTKTLIEEGRKKLFDFDYDFFDSEYKVVWETNFIRKFFMREIGFETETLFKFQLESWVRINIPYFNKMFESELIAFNPLINSKMESTSNRNKDSDQTIDRTKTHNQKMDATQNNDSFSRDLENNTPDSRLAITTADGKGIIEYASNITEGTKNGSIDSTNNVDGSVVDDVVTNVKDTEASASTREGKTGSQTYSKMMTEYRDSLVRIENKMYAEMQQLFMLVY